MSGVHRITLLGSGSSGGVPRANGDWGACDPSNPKNRRRRCSVLVERAETLEAMKEGVAVTRLVVDTSPDFREQMISARVPRLDAVLISHDHADQTHGLDDLRAFALLQKQRIPVWTDGPTAETLVQRFGYAFTARPNSPYPAILDHRRLPNHGEPVHVEGPGGLIEAIPFDQDHGWIRSVGYRFADLAYSSDINALPDESRNILKDLRCWIVDALRDESHPTHFSVSDALAAIERVGVREAVLTNMHITLDYDALSRRLPAHVRPGFDGLSITQIRDTLEYSL